MFAEAGVDPSAQNDLRDPKSHTYSDYAANRCADCDTNSRAHPDAHSCTDSSTNFANAAANKKPNANANQESDRDPYSVANGKTSILISAIH